MDQFAVQLPTGAPLSLVNLLINLAVGTLLALLLRWHFERFGSTLSNREEFAGVFPFILLTTTLIITVVKSSLALSLGLVGALSIVRFRTPRGPSPHLRLGGLAALARVVRGIPRALVSTRARGAWLRQVATGAGFVVGRLSSVRAARRRRT